MDLICNTTYVKSEAYRYPTRSGKIDISRAFDNFDRNCEDIR